MSLLSLPDPENNDTITSSQTTLQFALHPQRTLRISLRSGVSNPSSKTKHDDGRFAILNAHRIVSIAHVGVAANAALTRQLHYNDCEKEGKAKRSIALDTVINSGGSTHVGNVLKDFGFRAQEDNQTENDETLHSVIALGFDCTEEEMISFLDTVGGKPTPLSYLSRERTEEEIKDIFKTYKLTKEEVDISSLEEAVVTRIATKYVG